MKFSTSVTVLFVVYAVTLGIALEKACNGKVLTLSCNVSRNGTTVWNGTAFDCPSTNDHILFVSEIFNSSRPVNKSCGDDVIARVVSADDYIYRTELNFTANSPSSNGKQVTIQCGYDDGVMVEVITTYTFEISNCGSSSTDETNEPTTDMPGKCCYRSYHYT